MIGFSISISKATTNLHGLGKMIQIPQDLQSSHRAFMIYMGLNKLDLHLGEPLKRWVSFYWGGSLPSYRLFLYTPVSSYARLQRRIKTMVITAWTMYQVLC